VLVIKYARSLLKACIMTPRKVSESYSCFHEKPSLEDCHIVPSSSSRSIVWDFWKYRCWLIGEVNSCCHQRRINKPLTITCDALPSSGLADLQSLYTFLSFSIPPAHVLPGIFRYPDDPRYLSSFFVHVPAGTASGPTATQTPSCLTKLKSLSSAASRYRTHHS
jgi:hypothetical protein